MWGLLSKFSKVQKDAVAINFRKDGHPIEEAKT